MSEQHSSMESFELDEWLIEPQLNRIVRGHEQRQLEPRAMDVLVYLAQTPDETRSREEIIETVWGGASVIDGALYRAISTLRTGLEDDARAPRYVQTVPRRGYRLVAQPRAVVTTSSASSPTASDTTSAAQERSPSTTSTTTATSTAVGGDRSKRPMEARRNLGVAAMVALVLLVILLGWIGLHEVSRSPASVQFPALQSIRVESFESRGEGAESIALAATETVLALLGSIDGLVTHSAISDSPSVAVADAVLTATVASGGDRVRISAKLTANRPAEGSGDREPGEVIWGRVVEGELEDLLRLESDLASDLALELGRPAPLPPSWSQDVDPRVQQLYLAGRYHLRARSSEAFHRARSAFEEALALDDEFGQAHAALAETYLLLGNYLGMDETEARERAASAVAAAERLAPTAPETAIAMARVALDGNWDFERSELLARRALAAAPGSDEAAAVLADALAYSGQFDEAVDAIDSAIAANPGSLLHLAQRGSVLLHAGRFEEAEQQFDEVLALQPQYGWPQRYRSYALHRLGRHQEALDVAVAHADADPQFDDAHIDELRRLVGDYGTAGYWQWRLGNQQARRARGAEPHPAEWAESYAGSDQPDLALQWIDVALAERDDWLLDLLQSPAFDAVRGPILERRLEPYGITELARIPGT